VLKATPSGLYKWFLAHERPPPKDRHERRNSFLKRLAVPVVADCRRPLSPRIKTPFDPVLKEAPPPGDSAAAPAPAEDVLADAAPISLEY